MAAEQGLKILRQRLAERLAEMKRADHRMSARSLSLAVGRGHTLVKDILGGVKSRDPNIGNVIELAARLHCDVGWLLGEPGGRKWAPDKEPPPPVEESPATPYERAVEQAARRFGAALEEIRYPCPYCAEMIKPAARICPFCRSDLEHRQNAPNSVKGIS